MRGFLKPSVRHTASDHQTAFRGFSRGRRAKLAKQAHTTLVKADQWARGEGAPADVADALLTAVKALQAKKK